MHVETHPEEGIVIRIDIGFKLQSFLHLRGGGPWHPSTQCQEPRHRAPTCDRMRSPSFLIIAPRVTQYFCRSRTLSRLRSKGRTECRKGKKSMKYRRNEETKDIRNRPKEMSRLITLLVHQQKYASQVRRI